MVILLFCRFTYGEKEQFDYDDDLTSSKLLYVLGGLVATFVISIVMVQSFTRSSIWVPQPQQTLAVAGMNLSAVINDLFYQLALVANSEETMVLSLQQVMHKKFATSFSSKYRYLVAPLAVVLPRMGWGTLHAYVAYVGSLQWILVASAIISGIVISYMAYNKNVKSFLAALLIHFGFNAIVVVTSALGVI